MFHPKKMVGKQRLFYLNLQASFRMFSNQPNEVWSTIGQHSGSWQADKRGQRDLKSKDKFKMTQVKATKNRKSTSIGG